MNGAQALLKTLVQSGVNVCFGNPGTSEMHFVAALDDAPEMKSVLCLFEGVVSGAADGYGRMSPSPAATLLHLGPGLGNAMANLHNAWRARTPIVNIVGDHATYHLAYDAPLTSDVAGYAKLVSRWQKTPQSPNEVPEAAAEAVAASLSDGGGIASLILPADASWGEAENGPSEPVEVRPRPEVPGARIDAIQKQIQSGEATALLLGGRCLLAEPLVNASKIAAKTGVKLFAETFPSRLERGAGLPPIDRLAYLPEMMAMQLSGIKHLILVDVNAPVSFFAYPGKPSSLVPDGCTVHTLASPEEHAPLALKALVEALGAKATEPILAPPMRPPVGQGELDPTSLASAVGHHLPEGAIVVDESQTGGLVLPFMTSGAPPHSWLTLTGGAIGTGLPMAVGAALARPDRKVVNIEADGSAMYTISALWTAAREQLDIITILLNNRSYGILNLEFMRVGVVERGPKAMSMLDLSNPNLDFVKLAEGMGVAACRVNTADELNRALATAMKQRGPKLIEAMMPSMA